MKILHLLIIVLLISCENKHTINRGEFNDVVILTSTIDRTYLEPILNEYLFYDSLKTPENEPLYKL